MYKFLGATAATISTVFLVTGGARALLAFWFIIGVILAAAAVVVGLDNLLKRKKTI